jgi:hypothetical protein
VTESTEGTEGRDEAGSGDRLRGEPNRTEPERGAERPLFAADFPRDQELDALVEAFEAGNFARVREAAPRLAASTPDAKVKDAANVLLARTRPDPLATLLLIVSALLLVLLSAWWMAHNGKG